MFVGSTVRVKDAQIVEIENHDHRVLEIVKRCLDDKNIQCKVQKEKAIASDTWQSVFAALAEIEKYRD